MWLAGAHFLPQYQHFLIVGRKNRPGMGGPEFSLRSPGCPTRMPIQAVLPAGVMRPAAGELGAAEYSFFGMRPAR